MKNKLESLYENILKEQMEFARAENPNQYKQQELLQKKIQMRC